MKNLTDARAAAAASLGLTVEGAGRNLSQADFIRLQDEMVRQVLATEGEYAPKVVQWAQDRRGSSLYGTDVKEYSALDAAGDFTGEFANQALEVGDAVAGAGRGVLTTLRLSSWLIPLGVVAFVALFIWRRTK